MIFPGGILFDMDGTLTEPLLDFPKIKSEMGIENAADPRSPGKNGRDGSVRGGKNPASPRRSGGGTFDTQPRLP